MTYVRSERLTMTSRASDRTARDTRSSVTGAGDPSPIAAMSRARRPTPTGTKSGSSANPSRCTTRRSTVSEENSFTWLSTRIVSACALTLAAGSDPTGARGRASTSTETVAVYVVGVKAR